MKNKIFFPLSDIIDKIYLQRKNYKYRILKNGAGSNKYTKNHYFPIEQLFAKHQEEILLYLGEQNDLDKVKIILGIFIDSTSFADVYHSVRHLIKKTDNPKVQSGLIKVGRILLGFNPDSSVPFYGCLDDFYRDVHLNKQKYINVSTGHDIELIYSFLKKNRFGKYSRDKHILEAGCGQGRICNALAQRGIRGIKGIDISQSNLEEAKKNDPACLVAFHYINWEKVDFLTKGSIDCILNVGRNLHHVKNYNDLCKTVLEMKRLMHKKSKALVDFADNNTGKYKEYRKRLLQVLKEFGIPYDKLGSIEKQLEHIEYTVDTPDGKHWLLRYVPHKETIIKVFTDFGFKIKEYEKETIENWHGAQSIYYEVSF